MTAVKEQAYAKVNLYLDVLGLRADGFHEIKTVMHTVSLFDDVTVALSPARESSVKISIDGCPFLPKDDKNLAVKAAFAFLEHTGKKADVSIKLTKRIPVAAGLAGGSADAAAVLRALNSIYKKALSQKALMELGATIGSDVPFCVCGKSAVCLGRGEIIKPIVVSRELHFVIGSSAERVSTPLAYSKLDSIYSDFDGSKNTGGEKHYSEIIRCLSGESDKPLGTFNVFEEAVLPDCPIASLIKERLMSLGAQNAMMSGSGPAVFGIFDSVESATFARDALCEEGFAAYYAKSASFRQ